MFQYVLQHTPVSLMVLSGDAALQKQCLITVFSVPLLHRRENTHSGFLLPRGSHALKDARFPHGVELFDAVVMLVEVSVGLFPGLCHCVLWGERKAGFDCNDCQWSIYEKTLESSF